MNRIWNVRSEVVNTAVRLPREAWERAKHEALRRGVTLGRYVAEAVGMANETAHAGGEDDNGKRRTRR